MKQTAVQWLVEQVFGDHTAEWQDVIDKALEMEDNQLNYATEMQEAMRQQDGLLLNFK